ncbi:serine/threonine-protein kinase [Pseudonocardia endophytica]|uniref:serine/threonine-protein kinase n=1 Tax=Pseudonocardia endophytica TaxID=401976 RepID=UPI001404715B|nr:serine/threonine-protein kinase [Pseudonocardia endophytica]
MLLKKLGSGQFGEVWEALDTHRGHVVALKLLNQGSAPDAAWHEATRLTQLSSPYIVGINNASKAIDVPYIDTEYVSGGTVADAVAPHGVKPARAIKWIRQICTAVGLCHSRRVLHRDIRPDNMFILETDDVQLGDFGIAAIMDQNGSASAYGHPDAKAPEVRWGYPTNECTEVWSIGASLFMSLTGRLPHRDGAHKVVDDVRDVSPHVSRRLAMSVRRALDNDAASRFQTVNDLNADLAGVQRGKRDFCEIAPHSSHERCWIGDPVASGKAIYVCSEALSGRRQRLRATYTATGRRLSGEMDFEVSKSATLTQLRKLFDQLR